MAVPKQRTSHSRKNKRKAIWKQKPLKRSLKVPTSLFIYETMILPNRNKRPKGFKLDDNS